MQNDLGLKQLEQTFHCDGGASVCGCASDEGVILSRDSDLTAVHCVVAYELSSEGAESE